MSEKCLIPEEIKRKSGRPRIFEAMRKYTYRTQDIDHETFRRAGNGNVSAGIRAVAALWRDHEAAKRS